MNALQSGMAPSANGTTSLWLVQRLRKAALFIGFGGALLLMMFSDSHWRLRAPAFYELLEAVGIALILVCIAGRTWCTLYIGGRKKGEIVDIGPYSITRNPLYVFTFIGALGAGLQTGSLVIAALAGALTLAVFFAVVRKEEVFLADAFPETYPPYLARVPRFIPRFSLWKDAEMLSVRPDLVRRTFLDACLFLLAVPLADVIEWAQRAGHLPVLVLLP